MHREAEVDEGRRASDPPRVHGLRRQRVRRALHARGRGPPVAGLRAVAGMDGGAAGPGRGRDARDLVVLPRPPVAREARIPVTTQPPLRYPRIALLVFLALWGIAARRDRLPQRGARRELHAQHRAADPRGGARLLPPAGRVHDVPGRKPLPGGVSARHRHRFPREAASLRRGGVRVVGGGEPRRSLALRLGCARSAARAPGRRHRRRGRRRSGSTSSIACTRDRMRTAGAPRSISWASCP